MISALWFIGGALFGAMAMLLVFLLVYVQTQNKAKEK